MKEIIETYGTVVLDVLAMGAFITLFFGVLSGNLGSLMEAYSIFYW
jgi:hypothetical protein